MHKPCQTRKSPDEASMRYRNVPSNRILCPDDFSNTSTGNPALAFIMLQPCAKFMYQFATETAHQLRNARESSLRTAPPATSRTARTFVHSPKRRRSALRTRRRPPSTERLAETLTAPAALEHSLMAVFHVPTLNPQRSRLVYGPGKLTAPRFEKPRKRRTTRAHPLGRVLLIQPLDIRKPNRLHLVQPHLDYVLHPDRYTCRPVQRTLRRATRHLEFMRSWHKTSLFYICS